MVVRFFPSLKQQEFYEERRKKTLEMYKLEIKAKDKVIEEQERLINFLKESIKELKQKYDNI